MFYRQMILVYKYLPGFKSYSVLHYFEMLLHKPNCYIGSTPHYCGTSQGIRK